MSVENHKKNEMAVKAAVSEILRSVPYERVLIDEPMSRHTSFRIGGSAAAFVTVYNEKELAAALKACTSTGATHLLIGNGSNFLVADEGYPGIMIRLGNEEKSDFAGIRQHDEDMCIVTVGAARLLSSTSVFLTEKGLAGFEFASGIPGSIGGAVFMNAGAYDGEMKDVVRSVRLMGADGSRIVELSGDEMDFSYRHSNVEDSGRIVLSAVLDLTEGDPEEIAAKVAELKARRNEKQPIEFPSAGSTFKRPAEGYAAALIDQAGLKGYRVGGAMVSEKHAGFVINIGGATAEDVLNVMRHVRSAVMESSGIMLEPEVRLIGCSL